MPITTHEISLHGLAGAVFWCVFGALVFYVLGFATVGWEVSGNSWSGLWKVCSSSDHVYGNLDWFKAAQAMITIGLILLVACVIAMFIYMFIHSTAISKNSLIITFAVLVFAAAIFMLIGFIIFGSKHAVGDLNWSYAFCVIGAILCVCAGVISVVQMKQSNVF